jgi:hypothetical protein
MVRRLSADWPIKILWRAATSERSPVSSILPGRSSLGCEFCDQDRRTASSGLRAGPWRLAKSPPDRRGERKSCFRLLSSGATGWWVPAANVSHMISTQRQSWDYIYDFNAAYGETLAYMERTWPGAHHAASATGDLTRVSHGPLHLALPAASTALSAALVRLGGAKRELPSCLRCRAVRWRRAVRAESIVRQL